MAEKEKVKCIFCKGEAKLHYEDLNLLDGKMTLKGEPYYKCTVCKKEYVTSNQMKGTEEKINSFYITRPVIATGRSLAITLPPDISNFYSIKKGTRIQIIPESKTIFKIKLA